MATTNDSAVVDLGRLKTFKSKLDSQSSASSVNAATLPLPDGTNYKPAVAEGAFSCAFGNEAIAPYEGSVAIGASSVASAENEVSVGSTVNKRRIANVAAPTRPTDATTKEYVDSVTLYVVDTSGKTALTDAQLKEIDARWPYVAVINSNAICQGVSRNVDVTNGKTTSFSFVHTYEHENPGNSDALVGSSTKSLFVDQINIDATTGAITHGGGVSLFPIIATNPKFSNVSTVKAVGYNSIAMGSTAIAESTGSMALGHNSKASASAAMAIGDSARADQNSSVAFGMGSRTDMANQVSIGNKLTGVTRYLSNVKDPVQDQDAATRYWTKNADRSDVFANSTSINTYGGSGMFDLEANGDLKWVSVSGYTSWPTFATAWSKMVNLPGGNSNEWWIKTDLKVPAALLPVKSFISSHPCGLEFFSTYTMPARTFSVLVAVGSDGYIYIGKWTSKPSYGDEPYGIYLDGHRFYL